MKETKLFQNIPQIIVGRKLNFVSSVGIYLHRGESNCWCLTGVWCRVI